MDKRTILTEALHQREEEIFAYQINIDNFRLAIDYINGLPAEEKELLSAFQENLISRLKTEELEQKKTQVLFHVISQQLG
jgi:hypothetical protein